MCVGIRLRREPSLLRCVLVAFLLAQSYNYFGKCRVKCMPTEYLCSTRCHYGATWFIKTATTACPSQSSATRSVTWNCSCAVVHHVPAKIWPSAHLAASVLQLLYAILSCLNKFTREPTAVALIHSEKSEKEVHECMVGWWYFARQTPLARGPAAVVTPCSLCARQMALRSQLSKGMKKLSLATNSNVSNAD